MHILRVRSTLIVLTKFDEVPLFKLISSENLASLTNRYQFKSVDLGSSDNRPAVLCQLGVFQDQKELPIIKLAIEERKIVCDLEGSKSDVDALYSDIVDFLVPLSDRDKEKLLEPVVVTNESEIVVQLDFNVTSLLSAQYVGFLEANVVPQLGFGLASARIRPASIRFEVEYSTETRALQDYRISLSRKDLLLQPRAGYPLEDRVFVSKAPIDSELHKRLLSDLEKTLSEHAS